MIADLLESHQKGQNQPSSLDACGGLQLFGQFLDRLLVKRGLRFAQHTPRRQLCLLWQIVNDALVRFEPAQDIRPGKVAQRREMATMIVAQTLDRLAQTRQRCPAAQDK